MKFLVLSLAACTVLAAPMAFSAAAQTKSPAKGKTEKRGVTAKTAAPALVFEPVFWTAGAPLQAYAGNDPELVFKWLGAKIGTVKGMPDQFSPPEQEQVYQAALAEVMKGIGTIPLPRNCWGKKYDPAKQEYEISAFITSAPEKIKLPFRPHTVNMRTMQLKSVTLKEETVVFQNGYGAKFDVRKSLEESWSLMYAGLPGHEPRALLADNKADQEFLAKLKNNPAKGSVQETMLASDYTYKSLQYKTTFQMPSDEARAEDANLGCMYVISPLAPYIRSDDQFLSATRDWPKEMTTYRHYIYGKLDRFLVFNKKSGKVYLEAARDEL